jgi:hypothetical protein
MLKFKKWKLIVISVLMLPLFAACSGPVSPVSGPVAGVESALDTSSYNDPLDPDAVCGTLLALMVSNLDSNSIKKSLTTDIVKLNANLEILLARMKSKNLDYSDNFRAVTLLVKNLRKIESVSEKTILYDDAAKSWKNLMAQPLDPYCDDWYDSVDSTPTQTPKRISVVPGAECGTVDEISDNRKYICSWHGTGVWIRIEDSQRDPNEGQIAPPTVKSTGRFENVCQTVRVPNPYYDASKGFSAVVNEPTFSTRQCQQVWVPN